jgi:adenylate cyclase
LTSGQEIERRFLVREPPPDAVDGRGDEIEQGYLVVGEDGAEARLRRCAGALTLAVKRGRGLVRAEAEIALTEAQFVALWPLTDGARLRKVRHRLPLDGGLVAELDVYADALSGLVLCEVEFADRAAAAAFAPPAWLGVEVTEDERYRNRSLALHGRP